MDKGGGRYSPWVTRVDRWGVAILLFFLKSGWSLIPMWWPELLLRRSLKLTKPQQTLQKESYRFLLWVDIRVCCYPWLEQYKIFSGVGMGILLNIPRVLVTLQTISFSDSDRMCVNIKGSEREQEIGESVIDWPRQLVPFGKDRYFWHLEELSCLHHFFFFFFKWRELSCEVVMFWEP